MSVDIFLSSTLNNNNNIIRQPHKSHQNYPEQEQLQQQPPLLTSVSDETKELSNNDTTMTEHEGMSASEDNDNKSAKRKIIASAATTTTIRFKAETNGLIEKEKLKIRDTFLKQRESIRAIGKAIEKDGIVVNKSKICTTIKHILKEEIKNGIITRRSIEST